MINKWIKSIEYIKKGRFIRVRRFQEVLNDFDVFTMEAFKSNVIGSGLNQHLLDSLQFYDSPTEPDGSVTWFYLIFSFALMLAYVGSTGWLWMYRKSNYQYHNLQVKALLEQRDVKLCFFAYTDIRDEKNNGNGDILEQLEIYVAKTGLQA